jgi:hypothetical protein
MGCCASSPAETEARPMAGGQRVGTEGGVTVTRDEARERAAAAAEARAKAQNTRGQQGPTSKVKKSAAGSQSNDGRVNIADPRAWD